ncbi:hypothetical protein SAMN04487891_109169 [Flagellimonas taeanensis]|uniref:Chaperone of endosialidase n=1 Tax=Flagellimonas taeanensis TaxID=1005926 RepID=A0A1M7AUW6_9FLAO|nr:tail fiber protein [Allomuricauda taeanensis]SFC36045.1 hypothetical protein SAMN04487891_109169 [Allomuricauda taeanensis]SHL46219.1 hypothetical protein SAMN05216293_3542 [Allomuricauda taeanensis]
MKYLISFLICLLPILLMAQTNVFPGSGNVGIGTSNPLALFQMINNNNQFSIRPESNSAGTLLTSGQAIHLVFNDNNDGSDYFSVRANGTTFSSTDEFFRITSNGNVGIGTTSPTHLLTLNGGASSDGARTLVFERQVSGGAYNDIKASLGISGNTSQGGLRFMLSSDDGNNWINNVFFLQAGGNVGIGTTAPDSKLAVKGNIHAEEVKVDLSVPGPDYVFKERYDLKSLEEVKDYIKEHGHLPNIPSAKEMEENGIQLGEMNMKLLEKIEELTLYLIEKEETEKLMLRQLHELDEKIKKMEKSK